MSGFKLYVYRVLVALDRLANAVLGGRDTETISSRVYRNARKGYWYARLLECFLNLLFSPWDEEHCRESYENELNRVNVPAVETPSKE